MYLRRFVVSTATLSKYVVTVVATDRSGLRMTGDSFKRGETDPAVSAGRLRCVHSWIEALTRGSRQ